MKKGTVYENLWAGNKTYFVYQKQSKLNRQETAWGYIITDIDGKWKLRTGHFYLSDIKNDREHFPIVGHINIDQLLIDAILKEAETNK